MKRERRYSVSRFLFELFIVFIGVYGAFELNRYQQIQRESKIKENYFISFKSELMKLISNVKNSENDIQKELQRLNSSGAIDRNQPFIPLYLDFQESLLITQAGFNEDIFIQLDPALSSSLIGGYDNVKSLEKRVDNFNESTNILLEKRTADFYNSDGSWKTEYVWYTENLSQLKKYFGELRGMLQNGAAPAIDTIIEEFSQ